MSLSPESRAHPHDDMQFLRSRVGDLEEVLRALTMQRAWLMDAVDNDGHPYQSAALNLIITRAVALLEPAQ